ncbi:hypothetical protein BDF14DRAFT_1741660 [Spinellus fusiger]|nr:hypothetical protein BDF14DRAFT_1741660 [Spinellus fusiger]
MSSEKFRINNTGRSFRHSTNNFISTFSTSSPYSIGMPYGSSMTLDESSQSEKRTAHNALERQRREHLNSKFQQLAHALPTLQSERRPSKTMIVARSLDFVSTTIQRESNYKSQIMELLKENERLRKQARITSQVLLKSAQSKNVQRRSSILPMSQVEMKPVKNKKRSIATGSTTDTKNKEIAFQPSPPPTPEVHISDCLLSSSSVPTTIFPSSPEATLQHSVSPPEAPDMLASLDLQNRIQADQNSFIQNNMHIDLAWTLDSDTSQAIDELTRGSMNSYNPYLSPSDALTEFSALDIYSQDMLSLTASLPPSQQNMLESLGYSPMYMNSDENALVYNANSFFV